MYYRLAAFENFTKKQTGTNLPQKNTNMKIQKLVCFLVATTLLASCTKDETAEVTTAGTPVEVNMSLGLADAKGPDVTLTTEGNSPVAKTFNGSGAQVQSPAASDAPLKVAYSGPERTSLRASTTLNNVWVLQFDSTGVIGTAGNCVAVQYLGAVTVDDYLNLTLVTGTGQVIYVLANGPASGGITTTTYTLATLKGSAAFTGSLTDDTSIPYVGRIPGGVSLTGRGTIKNFATITLQRIAAKVSLKLYYSVQGYSLQSVQLCNAPLNMYYQYGSDAATFPATPSASDINASAVTANVVPSTASNGTYVWYTGENKRGTNAAITSAFNKSAANTPGSSAYCSFIRITAISDDGHTYYYYNLYIGADGTTDFNLRRNWEYSINASIAGTEDLQATYDALDGRISKRSMLTNCHILAPNNSITIPVNYKGNADATSAALGSLSPTHTAASVGIAWQTTTGLITCSNFNATNQTIDIAAGSTSGNAVVAAYSGANQTGDILWSWHIWVTPYDPDNKVSGATYSYIPTAGVTNVFMDRNLGALTTTYIVDANMLHYQWGRKDPFPAAAVVKAGASTSVDITITTPQSMLFSSQNPFKFISYNSSPYDWCSTPGDYYWMGTGGTLTTPGAKTIYDPCPSGWRVPAWRNGVSPWNGLSTTGATWGSGYTWPSIGFWPAAGYRYVSFSGALTNVGSYGYYWSASPSSSYGYYLSFSSGYVYPESTSSRANGFSVRCVQE